MESPIIVKFRVAQKNVGTVIQVVTEKGFAEFISALPEGNADKEPLVNKAAKSPKPRRRSKLSPCDYDMIKVVGKAAKPITISDAKVAYDRMDGRNAKSASPALSRAVKAGYVEAVPPVKLKGNNYRLTEQGKQWLANHHQEN